MGNIVNHFSQAKTAGRVTFPELNAALRTDYSFRKRLQVKHHNDDGRKSLIEDILVVLFKMWFWIICILCALE